MPGEQRIDVVRINAGLRNVSPERRNNQILRDLADAVSEVETLRAQLATWRRVAEDLADCAADQAGICSHVEAVRRALAQSTRQEEVSH